MNKSLITSFVKKPLSGTDGDDYWVHIEQVLPDSTTATLGEVASLVDALYGIDPCNMYDGAASLTTTPINATDAEAAELHADITDPIARIAKINDEKTAFFQDQIKAIANMSLCAINGADYSTQIKVGLSHPGDHYKLILSNGQITKSITVREKYSKRYVLDRDQSITLPFPVTGDYEFIWDPVVAGPFGYQHGPAITLTGRVLSWDVDITGSLLVRYDTIYDLVEVTVFGINSKISECHAICFYHGLLDEIDLEYPIADEDATENDKLAYCSGGDYITDEDTDDVITCYQTVTKEYRCRCERDRIAYTIDVDEEVPCPETITKCDEGLFSDTREESDGRLHCSVYMGEKTILADYVSCAETLFNNQTGTWGKNPENTVLKDTDYYETRCCHSPDGSLPECQEIWEKNNGTGLDPIIKKELQKRYGTQLELIAVSPEDGDCGYIKTTIGDVPKNCCDEILPIIVDEEKSAKVVGDNSSAAIVILEGKLPLTVSVRGVGFYLDPAHRVRDGIVSINVFYIYTADACGTCDITITDGCSVATYAIRSTKGKWVSRPDLANTCPASGMSTGTFTAAALDWAEITNGRWKVRQLYNRWSAGGTVYTDSSDQNPCQDTTYLCAGSTSDTFYCFRGVEACAKLPLQEITCADRPGIAYLRECSWTYGGYNASLDKHRWDGFLGIFCPQIEKYVWEWQC